jgi:TolB protein
MKIENIVMILLVAFILDSCVLAAKVFPTETVIPTSTFTLIPSIPTITPTPTLALKLSDCGEGDIIFLSNRDGNEEIYAINSDGTNLRNLTQSPARDINPFYSPDGKHMAFWSDRNGDVYNQDVFVMNSDGTDVINLTKQSVKLKGGSNIYWSLDGRKIGTIHTVFEYVIFSINPNTFEVVDTEIFSSESSDRTFDESEWYKPTIFLTDYWRRESWSPNHKCVVFANGGQIYIRSQLPQSKAIKITNDLFSNNSPVWQP